MKRRLILSVPQKFQYNVLLRSFHLDCETIRPVDQNGNSLLVLLFWTKSIFQRGNQLLLPLLFKFCNRFLNLSNFTKYAPVVSIFPSYKMSHDRFLLLYLGQYVGWGRMACDSEFSNTLGTSMAYNDVL